MLNNKDKLRSIDETNIQRYFVEVILNNCKKDLHFPILSIKDINKVR